MKSIGRDSVSARVRRQYSAFPFPGRGFMSREGLLLLKCLREWLEPGAPGNRHERPVRVIDVGCGTGNLLVSLSRHFPHTEFLGVDASPQALTSAQASARSQELGNLTFRRADLAKSMTRLGTFRLVICTGVLHHLEDIPRAFQRLTALVEPNGYLLVWLYGRHGRYHHRLNQEFLHILGESLPERQRLALARAFVKHLGPAFALNSGFYSPCGSGAKGLQWLLDNPEWLVDQMMPGFESDVTMAEILRLLEQNGLTMVQWLGMDLDIRAHTSSRVVASRFRQLTSDQQLIALDHLVKPSYYFVAARKRSPAAVRK
jgi:SAM-dependent methyltransferase